MVFNLIRNDNDLYYKHLLFVSGKLPKVQIPQDWITMVDPCTKKMRSQVQEELTAAMTYLSMVFLFDMFNYSIYTYTCKIFGNNIK